MIDWKLQQQQEEKMQGIAFASYYFGSSTQIQNLVPEAGKSTPDIWLPQERTLIEVKRVIDNADYNRSARWGEIVNHLQELVNNKLQTINVNGSYLIDTPWDFKLPARVHEAVVDGIIQSALSSHEERTEFQIENITFLITKVNSTDNLMLFGASGPAGSYDAASQMNHHIKHLLPKINEQLAFTNDQVNPNRKILLLINREPLLTWDWDLYKAMSYSYDELLTYLNIDEIWIQYENKSGFSHKFLYKRTFFEKFESNTINSFEHRESILFANWFSALYEMGEQKREKLLKALEYYLNREDKPYSMFTNALTRIEMVRFGKWLAEENKYDKLVWLIEKFIDDIDPPKPEDYEDNDKFNLHKRVVENENVNSITTVLGHLAWSIQALVLKKEYITQAFDFTKRLLSHENYYVKLQALIPLIEIAVRRKLLKEYDEEHNSSYYNEFYSLIFSLLDDLSRYKETRRWLVNLFFHIRDANTEDALKIIEKLKTEPESASILIYYALFRKRYTIPNIEFSSSPIEAILNQVLEDETTRENHLKNTIIHNFWVLLKNEPEEFETLTGYISSLSTQSYQKGVQEMILHITREWVERKPTECVLWYKNTISSISTYLENNQDKGRNIWLDYKEDILRIIAEMSPDDLTNVINSLFNIWMSGAYIGDLPLIFGSYKYIEAAELKVRTKTVFQELYRRMKAENEKLPELSWDS